MNMKIWLRKTKADKTADAAPNPTSRYPTISVDPIGSPSVRSVPPW